MISLHQVVVLDDGALTVESTENGTIMQHVVPPEAVAAYSLLLGVSADDALPAILATSQNGPPDWAAVYANVAADGRSEQQDAALAHLGVTPGAGVRPLAAASSPRPEQVLAVRDALRGARGAGVVVDDEATAAALVANDVEVGLAAFLTSSEERINSAREKARGGPKEHQARAPQHPTV